MAASVRGKLHAHQAKWRDDCYGWDRIDDWTLIVVADGAGSAPLSRVGARIACEECLKAVKPLLADYRPTPDDSAAMPNLSHLKTVLVEGARKALAGIQSEAAQRSCPVSDLHTTLLLVLHAPIQRSDLVGALQVGDGAVGLFSADQTCTVLGVADHGAYSNETRFLTTPGIEREFERRVVLEVKEGVRGIVVMSDGVADDFFPEDQRLVELFNGDPVRDLRNRQGESVYGLMKEVAKAPREGLALLEWLRYEKKGSSDDRTLVLLYRNGEG
jgi:serine/threonine protein phosphatase PrpC